MAVPPYHELFNPTLEGLRSLGGSASIRELEQEVARLVDLPDEDLAQPHGDGRQTELEYRIAWARTYLKAYGLINNSARGVWSLTPQGVSTPKVDAAAVVRSARKARKPVRDRRSATAPVAIDPEELEAELEEGWRKQLLLTLQSIAPSKFERLCQRLLRESGFVKVSVTGKSGDGGIDGVGIVRIGGLLGFPILFQCKRYSGSVGAGVIRDFRGAMIGRADRGLVITTGTFSREARMEATRDGAPPIDLLDGEELMDKLRELKLGVEVQVIEQVSVQTEWFDKL